MKRGITGVYHHVSPPFEALFAEYDFRYIERMALNVSDGERATKAVKSVVGKRMTYQQTDGGSDNAPI